MPYYKSYQRLEGSGPGVEFSPSRPYWINSYFIPPIDANQPVSLTLLSNRAGATTVVLAYFDENLQSIVGPPLADAIFAPDQRGLVVFTTTRRSGPCMLIVTSYNSTYTFSLSSVWSPFYPLRNLAIYSFLILPISLVMIYYDGIMEQREEVAEHALKGIRERRSSAYEFAKTPGI